MSYFQRPSPSTVNIQPHTGGWLTTWSESFPAPEFITICRDVRDTKFASEVLRLIEVHVDITLLNEKRNVKLYSAAAGGLYRRRHSGFVRVLRVLFCLQFQGDKLSNKKPLYSVVRFPPRPRRVSPIPTRQVSTQVTKSLSCHIFLVIQPLSATFLRQTSAFCHFPKCLVKSFHKGVDVSYRSDFSPALCETVFGPEWSYLRAKMLSCWCSAGVTIAMFAVLVLHFSMLAFHINQYLKRKDSWDWRKKPFVLQVKVLDDQMMAPNGGPGGYLPHILQANSSNRP